MKLSVFPPGAVIAGAMGLMAWHHGVLAAEPPQGQPGFVAHEWGTFTSVQASDGRPLAWKPPETSPLPQFVYSLKNPGPGRMLSGIVPVGGKGVMVTYQRMETPVIYFYSDKELTADVSVSFPKGVVTEWYPQARQMGPAFAASPAGSAFQDVTDSVIHWPEVKVTPRGREPGALPGAGNGSHYFSARATDANYVEVAAPGGREGWPMEREKFLFYRGLGSFLAPLGASMMTDNSVTLTNSGARELDHLFVLRIKKGTGSFTPVDHLKPGRSEMAQLAGDGLPVARVKILIGDAMAKVLVDEGLYPREAAAMVKTWSDSWFEEDGVRVLYTLPPAWTAEVLPMKIEPAPQSLVRVMIGRAEIITPTVENELAGKLADVAADKPGAGRSARVFLADLGRFATPALEETAQKMKPQQELLARFIALLPKGDEQAH